MKSTKKSLLASALALVVCLALLMGATFAWFTDSVSNTGNKIQAGTLGITAMAYDVDMSNTGSTGYRISGVNGDKTFYFEAAGQDLGENSAAIINENLWEPGQSNAKLLSVTNSGNLAAKVKLQFTVNDGGLQNALWFDFLQVDEAGTITGSFTKRPMSELSTLANALEISLAAGGKVQYILVYGMNEEAGNEYQGAKFSADVTILATQDTVETDGFGSDQYDNAAVYPVITTVDDADALQDALNQPGVPTEITVPADIEGIDALQVTGEVTMNMGTSMIYDITPAAGARITVEDGGSLTINAEANSGLKYNAGRLTAAGTGSSLTVNGGNFGQSGSQSAEVSALDGAAVTINDGTFSSSGASGHAVLAQNDGTVTVNGGSFGCSGANSILFYADGGTIVVEDCSISYVNGTRYGATNGGQILVSQVFASSQPSVPGCTVTDNGDGYWLISAQ